MSGTWFSGEQKATSGELTREALDEAFRQVRDRRWICKGCALTTTLDPTFPPQEGDPPNTLFRVIACPECGSHDWKQISKPIPSPDDPSSGGLGA